MPGPSSVTDIVAGGSTRTAMPPLRPPCWIAFCIKLVSARSSAGCIFKNPNVVPAGKLIDELGLKGTRVGGAVISDVHGNFIVNEGGATAKDVLSLIEIIRQRARAARGIERETEVEIVGES